MQEADSKRIGDVRGGPRCPQANLFTYDRRRNWIQFTIQKLDVGDVQVPRQKLARLEGFKQSPSRGMGSASAAAGDSAFHSRSTFICLDAAPSAHAETKPQKRWQPVHKLPPMEWQNLS